MRFIRLNNVACYRVVIYLIMLNGLCLVHGFMLVIGMGPFLLFPNTGPFHVIPDGPNIST